MDRNKIFFSGWNLKNVFEMEISIQGMNCRLTNMFNAHTRTASGVDLFHTIVLVSGRELLQVCSDVGSCTRVDVPGSVDVVRLHSSSNMLLLRDIFFIKPVLAPICCVPHFEAHLTRDLLTR